MKRVEVTVPETEEDAAEDVLKEFTEDITSSEVEREDEAFTQFTVNVDSDIIDDLTQQLKDIKDVESGKLTIEILDDAAVIEKGKPQEGGTASLSMQEMYAKAFEFATFQSSSWALIGLAAGIAVFGVLMENVMVVIGAMVIAPMLGPFISLSFGLVVGDRRLIRDSIFYGILSMFFGIAVAFLISLLISIPIPLNVTELMLLIAEPGFATIPLSLLVGAAAALTFSTEMRESLAGVAVAIALVPPAAVAGMTLSMLRFDLFLDVSLVLLTNLSALLLAGSITFKLVGIKPSTYYRKKVSEEKLREALVISVVSMLVVGSVLGYLSYRDLQHDRLQTAIEQEVDERFGVSLLRKTVDVAPSQVTVQLAVVNPDTSTTALEQSLSTLTDRDVSVTLLAVNGTVTYND